MSVEGKLGFTISKKTVGCLELIPLTDGLRVNFDAESNSRNRDFDYRIPLHEVGALWCTVRSYMWYRECKPYSKHIEGIKHRFLVALKREQKDTVPGPKDKVSLRFDNLDTPRDEDRVRFFLGGGDLVTFDLALSLVAQKSHGVQFDFLNIEDFGA